MKTEILGFYPGIPISVIYNGLDAGAFHAVSEPDLLEFRRRYQLCSLFVFPSSYEGFGIPILEAMAARCPIVLSNILVFREITEDQGIYFPPHDPERMASAVETVLYSSGETKRLVEYGSQRVQAFSFKVLAGQLEGLYRSLV